MNNMLSQEIRTMSSLEIAKLTEKQHKHVIVDIESLLSYYLTIYSAEKSAQLVKSDAYKDSSGKSNKCYLLSKDAALDLITGYSLPHRHAVNTRWQELESQKPALDPMQILSDPVAMRSLLLTYSEKVIALESTVNEQAPKVAALDRIATADGLLNITNTAKALQVQPKKLFAWLQENRWIYKRSSGLESAF